MKILVIGSGGREHALIWKIRQSPMVKEIHAAPGNAGMAEIAFCHDVKPDDVTGQIKLAKTLRVDLVVVGPEAPLAEGIIDKLTQENIVAFGPTQGAAILEKSKSYAKFFMEKYRIPTATGETCFNQEQALNSVKKRLGRCVIKADGLAAGKGVVICNSISEAENAIRRIMVDKEFGTAGNSVIVEDFLKGIEVSIMAICDGTNFFLLEPSQDHKALKEKDTGPNTGGMGAYSPTPFLPEDFISKIEKSIIQPTLNGMRKEGNPFKGVLYTGIMICQENPYVLEYNVRFGDPETQPLMMRLKSDIVPLLIAASNGSLNKVTAPVWSDDYALCVVLVSGGYPYSYQKGFEINGIPENLDPGSAIFHAGTAYKNNALITSGGRVLGVTTTGKTIEAARSYTYELIHNIHFQDMYYRKDIGWKVLQYGK